MVKSSLQEVLSCWLMVKFGLCVKSVAQEEEYTKQCFCVSSVFIICIEDSFSGFIQG